MTLTIVIATVLISLACFSKEDWMIKLMLNPYRAYHKKEIYRLITHGFLHADWIHLIINMLVLFSFGRNVERWFEQLQYSGMLGSPGLGYGLLYFGGIIVSSLVSLVKHKDNPDYNSVGASGAVSAVIFTSIFFMPLEKLLFFGVIPIPGIVFAGLYLIYSSYMSKRGRDNINHDAHFTGAIFGFVFPLFIDPALISHFISQITQSFSP